MPAKTKTPTCQRESLTNPEKLAKARQIIKALEDAPTPQQLDMLAAAQTLVSGSNLESFARILRVLGPVCDDHRTDVLRSVAALVGDGPTPTCQHAMPEAT